MDLSYLTRRIARTAFLVSVVGYCGYSYLNYKNAEASYFREQKKFFDSMTPGVVEFKLDTIKLRAHKLSPDTTSTFNQEYNISLSKNI